MVTLKQATAEEVADVLVGKMLDHNRKAHVHTDDPSIRSNNLKEAMRLYHLSVAVDPCVVARVNLKPVLKQMAVLKEHLST